MSRMFDVQKISVYGSFGEFSIGEEANTIKAKYLLTKIKPGNDGTWECQLASQMRPWREVFNVEELDFDELLQRDLDDSRVAHDLIPYLIGESGSRAKFFPPILAVIVPRKQTGSGIEELYPARKVRDESIENFGDLFDFEQVKWDSEPTPLGKLSYNMQRSAFIIVDGQHRAMAVLALHRQLNRSWSDNAFASYYDHISVAPEQIKNIELPVCIIYFPDLHKDNPMPKERGINLRSVCRDIFLVVNRSAKRVSEARTLLLDDEDIAARLMRKTLSTLKKREEESAGLARIYSISYGDSDTELGQKEVISGQLEYSSAIAIHKIHSAISFGTDEGFRLNRFADISDGRRTRNKNRPAEILLGTKVETHSILPRNSGKLLPPNEVDEIVERLGELADTALIRLFDQFLPFTIHNSELQSLRRRLSDVHARSQIEQKKAYTLIFEGSGVRNVFDSHFERLREEKSERERDGDTLPDHLQSQIEFGISVKKVLDAHERDFQRRRACRIFRINAELFNIDDNPEDQIVLSEKSRKLFQTLATQAFQLGYAMTIFTVVEELKREKVTPSPFNYQDRLELVQFVTDAYLAALNSYFSPIEKTEHRALTGYILEPRASVFDSNSLGLRGLLAMSVNELNERQWRFFRYAILEIVHSPFCWDAALIAMKQKNNEWALEWYNKAIPRLVSGIISERGKYVEDAVKNAVNESEFKLDLMQRQAQAKGEGKSEEEIQQLASKLEDECEAKTKKKAFDHLKSSLKTVQEEKDMIKQLLAD